MPESGLRAPARILVAVRAMVPVTLMPPNSADAMLAMPCATNSMLERCLRPVMVSATQLQEEGRKAGIAFATDESEYQDLLMLRKFLESPCDSDFAAELFSHY